MTNAAPASPIVHKERGVCGGQVPKNRLLFPSFASTEATAPLGILAVATPLIRAGYEVVLIDSTITPNYKKRVLEEAARRDLPGHLSGDRTDDSRDCRDREGH